MKIMSRRNGSDLVNKESALTYLLIVQYNVGLKPWVSRQCVIVVYPGHTHFLFKKNVLKQDISDHVFYGDSG